MSRRKTQDVKKVRSVQTVLCDLKKKKKGNEPIEILFLSCIVEISAAFSISDISVNDFWGMGRQRNCLS